MVYYFASDVHLGLDYTGASASCREQKFVRWLKMVEGALLKEGGALFLMGDIFDYWYEYKRVVPRGFVRTFGQLAAMTDAGLEVHFFSGNHDMWVDTYFERELGIVVHHNFYVATLNGVTVFMQHGHGIITKQSPFGFRFMNGLFKSRLAYKIYSWLVHPNINMAFGSGWSLKSRLSKSVEYKFSGEKEPVVVYARERLLEQPVDHFIFGHLHSPTSYALTEGSTLHVLGQWVEGTAVYGKIDSMGKFCLEAFD